MHGPDPAVSATMFDVLTSPAVAGGAMCFAGILGLGLAFAVLYRTGRS